jgi:hypothetical protein
VAAVRVVEPPAARIGPARRYRAVEEVPVDELGGYAEPDGPPPTPHERARARRRRRWTIAIVVVALVALALPAAALLLRTLDLGSPQDPSAAEPEPAPPEAPEDDPGAPPSAPDDEVPRSPVDPRAAEERGLTDADRPDPEVPDEDRIDVPDVAGFDGLAADQIRLLADVDASERAMIAFQMRAGEAFFETQEIDELRARISGSARDALDELDILRALLGRPVGDTPTTRVRDRYVEHLDTWVAYLEAVEANPDLVFVESTRYTVPINVSGSRFTEQVELLLDGDVDDEVRRIAEAIIARGFAGPEQSQV